MVVSVAAFMLVLTLLSASLAVAAPLTKNIHFFPQFSSKVSNVALALRQLPHGASNLTSTNTAAASSYWYENIDHNGISAFAPNSGDWKVFRNVVNDYQADSTGNSDASQAIQNAINDAGSAGGSRSDQSLGTTKQPAVVYLPSGTYSISSPLQLFVGTVLMGNPQSPPVIKASGDFNGNTMIYAKDPNYDATTSFYIGVKNLAIDSTGVDGGKQLTLLDWSVSQACQLANVVFDMPDNSDGHVGVSTPEGGSGTMMGDLTFNGGFVGLQMNNQQYEGKSMTFNRCRTGIQVQHCFDCVFVNNAFNTCGTGIDTTGNSVGSVILLDSSANSVGTVVNTNDDGSGSHTIVLENFSKGDDISAVVKASGNTILNDAVPDTWIYGYVVNGDGNNHVGGQTYTVNRPGPLLASNKFLTTAPPTYASNDLSEFQNVKSVDGQTVKGDGVTDDTAALQAIISQFAATKILFFPHGTYLVSDTLSFPPGSRVVGEGWSEISATGDGFKDANSPKPMVQVGKDGDSGTAEFSDMLFTVADILPGCVLLEVNMAGSSAGSVGLWNSHFRIGGAAGSKVETNCGGSPSDCKAAFLLMHLTKSSSAYVENMWGWTADHDLDGGNGQTISTGRGFLVEATAATWLHGTASEHNTLYQYNFQNAQNVFVGMQQSESPYWQGNGGPALTPDPWDVNANYGDPDFSGCDAGDGQCRMAWYQIVDGSSALALYGSGFWTFFNDNDSGACSGTCQTNGISISNTKGLSWMGVNTKSVQNVIVDGGNPTVTQDADGGSWGACVGGYFSDQ